jgi:hypothetical protein
MLAHLANMTNGRPLKCSGRPLKCSERGGEKKGGGGENGCCGVGGGGGGVKWGEVGRNVKAIWVLYFSIAPQRLWLQRHPTRAKQWPGQRSRQAIELASRRYATPCCEQIRAKRTSRHPPTPWAQHGQGMQHKQQPRQHQCRTPQRPQSTPKSEACPTCWLYTNHGSMNHIDIPRRATSTHTTGGMCVCACGPPGYVNVVHAPMVGVQTT